MKKSLVFAMAMAMGVTASAYAANPFSDVPAGHWAYDSVAKLADAGIVDGYGATFGGEKLMTRYEMAQVVAKAMAKGANVDKLAAEFADELDALGVRVAKLEKKVDNVKITGQIRFDYKDHDLKGGQSTSIGDDHGYATLRTRIFVNGQINDNWSYTGMLQNHRGLTTGTGDDAVKLKRAYVEGRLGGVKVLAGHWNEFFICDTILDDFVDGVYAEYGVGNGKVYGLAGKGIAENGASDSDRLYVAGISQKFGPVNAAFNWFKADFYGMDHQIYNINADWAFAKDFNLTARYMWAAKDVCNVDGVAKDGWYAQLDYKAADPAKAGTWGVRARYFDQPKNVWLHPTYDATHFDPLGCTTNAYPGFGYEGWGLGADYVFAKNIMLQVDYYDTEAKCAPVGLSKQDDKVIYSQLWFFF